MYNLHTADVVPVVNEKTTSYVKGERETFPDPDNGFELIANLNRSPNQKLLTIAERAMYILLADFVGRKIDGKYWCCPSVKTLADCLSITDRGARKLTASLAKKGFIEIEERIRNGANTSNAYWLTPTSMVKGGGTTVQGVRNNGSGGGVNHGSYKETTKEETRAEETSTTPKSPKRGKREERVYDSAIFKAICMECKLDPIVNQRSVTTLAVSLTRAGYSADHVHDTAEIVRDGWVDYTGPVTVKHIRERITESVPEEDREQIWR